MSIDIYKVIHVSGIIMLFSGLCALLGVYSSDKAPSLNWRLFLAITHGIGMAFLIVSGFGILARLGLTSGIPNWVYAKLVIWLLLGGSMVLAKRRAHLKAILIVLWITLGSCAAYLGFFKPF